MKLLSGSAWFSALWDWRGKRHGGGPDPADMGTAFGLDSITVVDFDSTLQPRDAEGPAVSGWERRVARRSRL